MQNQLRRTLRAAASRSLALAGLMLLGMPLSGNAAPGAGIAIDGPQNGSARAPLSSHRLIESRANTFTGNHQVRPAVAVDPTGRTMVVWASRRQELGTFGVFGQWFDALGRRLGTEVHVNQFHPGTQHEPDVALDATGCAWVVWESLGQDGEGAGIYLRRFAPAAPGESGYVVMGDEVRVNDRVEGDQVSPSIAINSRGDALVCWMTETSGSRFAVVGRLFGAHGQPTSAEFAIGVNGADGAAIDGSERHIACAALADGRFVAAWDRFDTSAAPSGIFAALIELTDNQPRVSRPITVASPESTDAIEPSIASDGSDRFVVAWMQSRQDGAGYDVAARLLGDAGPLSDAFIVSSDSDGWKNGAAAAMHSDGRFLIAWNVEQDDPVLDVSDQLRPARPADLFARTFDEQGQPLGSAFRINSAAEGHQTLAAASNSHRIAWSGLDTLAAVWHGSTGDDNRGIGLTILAPSQLDLPAPPAVEPLAAAMDLTAADVRVPPEFDPFWKKPPPDANIASVGPDFGFQAFQRTPWNPPDPDLAVGPGHIVAVVNMHLAVYTKDGTRVFDQLLEDFFREQGAVNFVFDPIAAWDPFADRFVVATTEHNSSRGANIINIAVSRTTNPLDGWHKYSFVCDSIGNFIDFPNLGVGTDAYYITTDYFSTPTGNHIQIFEKAPMLSGQPVQMKNVRTSTSTRSLGAIKTYDQAAVAQYFVTSFSGSSTRLSIDAIRSATGTPVRNTVDLTVPSYSNPPEATQRGSSNRVSTVDRRIKAGVFRNGRLWVAHAIGQDNTARVRWYEIDPRGWPVSGNTPVLVQSGTFNYGAGEHNWFPDIDVDAQGNAVIAMNCSSANDYVYIARTVRRFDDAPESFRPRIRLQESTSPEPGSRWGDYSGISEDPAQPGVFWSHTEYRTTDWRTWIGRIDANRCMVLEVDRIVRGQQTTMTVTSARANTTVYFAYSIVGTGEIFVPFLNVTIGLRNPQLIGTRTTDATGSAVMTMNVPSNAPRVPVWIQAAELGNASNIIAGQIN